MQFTEMVLIIQSEMKANILQPVFININHLIINQMKKFRIYDNYSNLLAEVPENSNLLNSKITAKVPLVGDKITIGDKSYLRSA
jgi:hypothetical protein